MSAARNPRPSAVISTRPPGVVKIFHTAAARAGKGLKDVANFEERRGHNLGVQGEASLRPVAEGMPGEPVEAHDGPLSTPQLSTAAVGQFLPRQMVS